MFSYLFFPPQASNHDLSVHDSKHDLSHKQYHEEEQSNTINCSVFVQICHSEDGSRLYMIGPSVL